MWLAQFNRSETERLIEFNSLFTPSSPKKIVTWWKINLICTTCCNTNNSLGNRREKKHINRGRLSFFFPTYLLPLHLWSRRQGRNRVSSTLHSCWGLSVRTFSSSMSVAGLQFLVSGRLHFMRCSFAYIWIYYEMIKNLFFSQ